MSESQDFDLKRCPGCGQWMPGEATKCAACDANVGPVQPGEARAAPPPVMQRPATRPMRVNVTKALIWANLAFYVWSLWVTSQGPSGGGRGLLSYAIGGPDSWAFRRVGWYLHARTFGEHEWWRIFTACFLHGGLMHIGFNMYALHQLGRICEDLFGQARYLAIYLVCGGCSMLAVSVWNVGFGGEPNHIPVVGASGAIFGLGGLLITFLRRHGSGQGRALARALTINLGLLIVIGFMGWVPISNTGHIGGLIPGLMFGLFVGQGFSSRLSPATAKRWDFAAAVMLALTALALANGVWFALRNLPEGN